MTAPLLSPPPIAVIWRPIVLLPFGFAAWMVACWLAVLGTTFYLVYRTGLPGALVACILAPAIGEQLAAGNVAAFFPVADGPGLEAPGPRGRPAWRSG